MKHCNQRIVLKNKPGMPPSSVNAVLTCNYCHNNNRSLLQNKKCLNVYVLLFQLIGHFIQIFMHKVYKRYVHHNMIVI